MTGLRWRRSPVDDQAHVIHTEREDGIAEALCPHRVPAEELRRPAEGDRRCPDCLAAVGQLLSASG